MGSFLTKVYNVWAKKYSGVMFDSTEYWCKIWRKTDRYFQKWHRNLENFQRLKNSDFILQSKISERNQDKTSKQADRPEAVWKLYFTFEINE